MALLEWCVVSELGLHREFGYNQFGVIVGPYRGPRPIIYILLVSPSATYYSTTCDIIACSKTLIKKGSGNNFEHNDGGKELGGILEVI